MAIDPGHEGDDACESGVFANLSVDVFLVWMSRAVVSRRELPRDRRPPV
jgi:hypothetical protein